MTRFPDDDVVVIAQQVGVEGHEVDLARVLRSVEKRYEADLLAYNARRDPPPRDRPSDPAYAQWTADGGDGWTEDDYDFLLKRPRGNPGTNRKRPDGPPTASLYIVYEVLAAWWEDTTGKPFAPDYHREYGDVGGREPGNPSGLLFYLVAKNIDPGYTAENCYSVREGKRRKRKHFLKSLKENLIKPPGAERRGAP